jgi:hypothetical protein
MENPDIGVEAGRDDLADPDAQTSIGRKQPRLEPVGRRHIRDELDAGGHLERQLHRLPSVTRPRRQVERGFVGRSDILVREPTGWGSSTRALVSSPSLSRA